MESYKHVHTGTFVGSLVISLKFSKIDEFSKIDIFIILSIHQFLGIYKRSYKFLSIYERTYDCVQHLHLQLTKHEKL